MKKCTSVLLKNCVKSRMPISADTNYNSNFNGKQFFSNIFFVKIWWVMYSEMHIWCYNIKNYNMKYSQNWGVHSFQIDSQAFTSFYLRMDMLAPIMDLYWWAHFGFWVYEALCFCWFCEWTIYFCFTKQKIKLLFVLSVNGKRTH